MIRCGDHDFILGIHKSKAKETHHDHDDQEYQKDHQNLFFTLTRGGAFFGASGRNVRTLDQNTVITEGVSTSLQNAVGHFGMDHMLSLDGFSAGADIVNLAVDLDGTCMKGTAILIIDQLVVFFMQSVFQRISPQVA